MSGRRYVPPPLGLDPLFVGRAGVVIEVAPDQFYEFILEIRHGDPSDLAEVDLTWLSGEAVTTAEQLDPSSFVPSAIQGDIHLRGRVISKEEADRPSWASAPQGEIEARRELES